MREMYGRRWDCVVMMTTWLFILSLSFQCLLADIVVVSTTTKSTTSTTNNPRFKGKFQSKSSSSSSISSSGSRRQAGVNPQATSVPILPTLSSPDPPHDQLQRPYQPQQRDLHKSIGYVAEWEYEGSRTLGLDDLDESFRPDQLSPLENGEEKVNDHEKVREEEAHHPSKRVGPGTWLDSSGSWWLFGGQRPTSQSKTSDSTSSNKSSPQTTRYLSDLWVYDHGKSSWRLVFRPESETTPIHSSYPENLAFPHICGSEVNGHMAVFGGGSATGTTTTNMKTSAGGRNAQTISFTDDNIVWLFDIPMNGKGGNVDSSSQQQQQQQQQEQGLDSWDGSEGLWTSYICCDACLPDGNTTLEFCPRFSREPILWCGHDSLMALQISHSEEESGTETETRTAPDDGSNGDETLKKKKTSQAGVNGDIKINTSLPASLQTQQEGGKGKSGESSRGGGGDGKSRDTTTRVVNKAKSNVAPQQIISNGNSNRNEGRGGESDISGSATFSPSPGGTWSGQQKKKSEIDTFSTPTKASLSRVVDGKSFQATATQSEDEMKRRRKMGQDEQKERKLRKSPLRATWWKFDLAATEWERMPEVREESVAGVDVHGEVLELIEQGDCRTVSDQTKVYILCPTSSSSSEGNVLERTVLVFDPTKSSIQPVDGRMELNNAFRDGKVWQLGRSTLHALRTDNHMTLLFLAYHKLLDVWIHDHRTNQLYPVENVWKGPSLHVFQRTTSFYKITVSFPPSPNANANQGGFEDSSNSAGIPSSPPNKNNNQGKAENQNYSFYMSNPRSQLFEFKDDSEYFTSKEEEGGQHVAWMSSGRFHITIVPDQAVFLPSRDASFYLISSRQDDDSQVQSKREEENHQPQSSVDKGKINENEKDSQTTLLNSTIPSSSSLSSPVPPPSSSLTAKSKAPTQVAGKSVKISNKRKIVDNGSSTPSVSTPEIIASATIKGSIQGESTTAGVGATPLIPSSRPGKVESSSFNLSHPDNNNNGNRGKGGQNNASGQSTETSKTTSSITMAAAESGIIGHGTIRSRSRSRNNDSSSNPITVSKNEDNSQLRLGALLSGLRTTTTIDPQNRESSKLIPHSPPSIPSPIGSTKVKPDQHDDDETVNRGSSPQFKETSKRTSTLTSNPTTTNKNLSFNSNSSSSDRGVVTAPQINLSPASILNVTLTSTSSFSAVASKPTLTSSLPSPTQSLPKKPTVAGATAHGNGNPKRIPKGILKNGNVKTAEGEHDPRAKVSNLLAVRRPSVAVTSEPLKNAAKKREEIPPVDENESLRTNRMVGVRNSSRERDHDDHDEVDGGRVEEEKSQKGRGSSKTTPTPPTLSNRNKPTVRSGGEDDTGIHVTLSYTMVRNSKSRNNAVKNGDAGVVRGQSSNSKESSDADESLEGDGDGEEEEGEERSNSLTYGSSEIVLDTHDTIRPIGVHDGALVPSMGASYSSMLFFAVSLSIFGTFGIVLFFRRCVKCPPRTESVLIKEPPPIRYSVIPDELSYHTPIV